MYEKINISLDKRTLGHSPKKFICPSCGQKTLSRYYNFDASEYLPEDFGRCDRENNCSYHVAPDKDYFRSLGNGNTYKPTYIAPLPKQAQEVKPDFIPLDLVNPSFDEKHTVNNQFIQFLVLKFGIAAALRMVNKYHIGTSKHWQGSNIFWQIDIDENVRTGKIMLYDMMTCKRVKQPYNHVTWVHSELLKKQHISSFNLVQCFFGEHLLNETSYPENKGKTIAIVESAKTAIIADECLKHLDYVWLSSEGSTGLNIEKCKVLRKREVILFPDLDAEDKTFAKWTDKAREIRQTHRASTQVSRVLYEVANPQEKMNGFDLGDYLLRLEYDKQAQILNSDGWGYPFSWDV